MNTQIDPAFEWLASPAPPPPLTAFSIHNFEDPFHISPYDTPPSQYTPVFPPFGHAIPPQEINEAFQAILHDVHKPSNHGDYQSEGLGSELTPSNESLSNPSDFPLSRTDLNNIQVPHASTQQTVHPLATSSRIHTPVDSQEYSLHTSNEHVVEETSRYSYRVLDFRGKRTRKQTCPHCGKHQAGQLNRHIDRSCPKSPKRRERFECSECDPSQSFSRIDNLRRHIRDKHKVHDA